MGGEEVSSGSEAGGGRLVATGAPEENCSKALSHLFIVQFLFETQPFQLSSHLFKIDSMEDTLHSLGFIFNRLIDL